MKVGDKVNSLTITEVIRTKRHDKGYRVNAKCVCDCGNICVKEYYSVKKGRFKMCTVCAIKKRNINKATHNLSKHPLYRKWQDMKKRCYNPNVDRYNNYGALGIKVCDEWKESFKSFYDWSISNGWKNGLTIERDDIGKDYSPENCRYITLQEQAYNKKTTKYVEYKGEKVCLAKLLTEWGVPEPERHKYYHRIDGGYWDIYRIESDIKGWHEK